MVEPKYDMARRRISRRRNVGAGYAIQTEIKTGLTFAKVALSSRSASKTARNTANAHRAYDTARRWAQEMALTPAESKEIADQLEALKAELAKLETRSKSSTRKTKVHKSAVLEHAETEQHSAKDSTERASEMLRQVEEIHARTMKAATALESARTRQREVQKHAEELRQDIRLNKNA